MPQITKISEIVYELDELIKGKFTGKSFWVTAEISGVKKYPNKRWCFFDFVEKMKMEKRKLKVLVGQEVIKILNFLKRQQELSSNQE